MNVKCKKAAEISVLITILCLIAQHCLGADTITSSNFLSGDQTITSSGGSFELGFFRPGNSQNNYIGIWYKKIPGQAVIWAANRDNPVSDKQLANLRMSSDGNLVLVSDNSEFPIWSTNLNSSSNSNTTKSSVAVLLDNGNLVLRDSKNSSSPLWQSFDHPTDTLMPGQKLGFNKQNKWKTVLNSWKNSDDPATGLYTIERDPNANQFIMIRNRTVQYWQSGLWNPQEHIFSLVPELRYVKSQIYDLRYIDNENETYSMFIGLSTSKVSRIIMDVSGQLKQLTWQDKSQQWVLGITLPAQQCEVYSYCGAFSYCNQTALPFCHCVEGFQPKSMTDWQINDYSEGCTRKTKLVCQNQENGTSGDEFLSSPSKVLPEHPQSVSNSNQQECELACLRDCSCTAYAYDDKGCFIWFGELLNMRQLSESDPSGKLLHIRVAASDIRKRTGHIKKVIIGTIAAIGMGILFLLALAIYLRRKRRFKSVEMSLTRFVYKDLQSATKNFSVRLGGGGFGSVFKGTLPDSTVIAVKKLECSSQAHGEKQFRAEVTAVGIVQHVNLVRLHGFCSEGTKRLLVYEYMPNGSLNSHLFNNGNPQILQWKLRYQIAIEIARGLTYLHEKCRDCIIHCDIKPENILLDAEFCAKVADFGLAKLVGRDFSRVLTTMRGTRGYLAPEWISGVAITAKADVYSYGMMLFEIVSGRRNTQNTSKGLSGFFPTWAMKKINEGQDVLSILDPRLKRDTRREEVMTVFKLAGWCIQDNEQHRPSMGKVVQVLEGLLDLDMPPVPWSLQMFEDDDDDETTQFFSELSSMQPSTQQTNYASHGSATP